MLEKGIMAITIEGYKSGFLPIKTTRELVKDLGAVMEITNRANMVLQE